MGNWQKSPYAQRFTQGATLAPLLAFVVSKQDSSPLGLSQGRMAVKSQRSVNEKKPWKDLPALSGVVESQFVRPMLAGENVFPFGTGKPMLAVIPCDNTTLFDQEQIDLYPGLQQWWAQASQVWEERRSSERLSLREQANFQSKLSKQLPIPPLRIVYNRSGMHICCAKLRNRRAIVANGLYWASAASEREADYICALLNAPATTELTRPLMSYGKDERDIHKHVWELPLPLFDPNNTVHARVAQLGAALEKVVADFKIDESIHFAATRRHIRELIVENR